MKMKRGDILEASDRRPFAGKHYIIFYDDYNGNDFVGAMITHSAFPDKNVQMEPSHFETADSYKITYGDSWLVIAKLRKFQSWGPFTKVGKLTDSGIKFVESNIDHLDIETWDEYLNRTRISYSS